MADPLELNLERVLVNARQATTVDLLNRVTVFRAEMEPAAVDIIEKELFRRGVGPREIAAHEEAVRHLILRRQDGTVVRCTFCHQPAVTQAWGWHRLWGLVPVFPRYLSFCKDHLPGGTKITNHK